MANKIENFFKDIKTEMAKVSWPTRQELKSSTVVVIVSLAILSLFIGICDLILSNIINVIIARL